MNGKRDFVKEQIQPLVDYQDSINKDIAKTMILLKTANKTNEGNVYGFLPSENEGYLSRYDDNELIKWIEKLDNNESSVKDLLLNNIEEGYYCIEESSGKEKLFGNISLINDYQGISHAEVSIEVEDKTIYKAFKWNYVRNAYEAVDGTKEFEFKFSKENEQLFGQLKDIENQKMWKFALKKYIYLNGINITLAVREYFLNKKDGVQYTFDTCDFQKIYVEQYIIPVYQVKDDKVEELYSVVVASTEFEESGDASVFLSDDLESVIAGEKTFLDIVPLEEFNVCLYFPFE